MRVPPQLTFLFRKKYIDILKTVMLMRGFFIREVKDFLYFSSMFYEKEYKTKHVMKVNLVFGRFD